MEGKTVYPENNKPLMQNKFYSKYRFYDQDDNKYIARIFLNSALQESDLTETINYNTAVLSDLDDQIFPQHFLKILQTYENDGSTFIFTENYQNDLESYLKSKVIEEKEVLNIFDQILKSVYSLYRASYIHRNLRPEHFVLVQQTWKLQTLILTTNYQKAGGQKCAYFYNPAYQPPQAYKRDDFTDDQLDEMIVWNLGSILVDLLLSHHKLKNEAILNRYKGHPFDMRAVGVKLKFSNELNEVLGKMLHYNPQKRMTFDQLFSNKFLSPSVALQHQKLGKFKKERAQPRASFTNITNVLNQKSISNMNEIMNKQVKARVQQMKEEQALFDKQNNLAVATNDEIQKIIRRKKKRKTILTIDTEENNETYSKSINVIKSSLIHSSKGSKAQKIQQAIEHYKNAYEKYAFLVLAGKRLQQYNENSLLPGGVIDLTNFATTLAALIGLYKLCSSFNRNKQCFDIQDSIWEVFNNSQSYEAFKYICNFKQKKAAKQLGNLRQKILNSGKFYQEQYLPNLIPSDIDTFLSINYRTVTYSDIKKTYRKIINKAYREVAHQFNNNKSEEACRVGIYLIFCLSFDKIFNQNQVEDLLAPYFEWKKIQKTKSVQMNQFQEYIQKAQYQRLVSHSRNLMDKMFKKPLS